MVSIDTINNAYFDWIYRTACGKRFPKNITYKKLFMHLHTIEFRYYLARDSALYSEGLDLRYRFAYKNPEYRDAERYIEGPCSVLEMMFSLAINCEEHIMDNTMLGDRTTQWFWGMLTNMGLGSMDDSRFNREEVDFIVDRFLDRKYEPNGKGGLFTIYDCDCDLRDVEIWTQLCWYLNSIS